MNSSAERLPQEPAWCARQGSKASSILVGWACRPHRRLVWQQRPRSHDAVRSQAATGTWVGPQPQPLVHQLGPQLVKGTEQRGAAGAALLGGSQGGGGGVNPKPRPAARSQGALIGAPPSSQPRGACIVSPAATALLARRWSRRAPPAPQTGRRAGCPGRRSEGSRCRSGWAAPQGPLGWGTRAWPPPRRPIGPPGAAGAQPWRPEYCRMRRACAQGQWNSRRCAAKRGRLPQHRPVLAARQT